ncbi:MAG TPA: isoprenylcysteine carboxylmethyltransferase family protein [Chitinophagaceae bacterium]|jgi:protein-S-isoprenylcysteine O-methyltransferase Ste14|nr:isoprenylcysteine carboxylmethyltransferase family protein [Chitinophagaceae bacterium]
MPATKDNPGIVIPPPLFYAATFLLSLLIQKAVPIDNSFFHSMAARIAGIIFIGLWVLFAAPSLLQFFKTKNTLITIKPANSLQTTGIYSISRNPMYVSLLSLYTGLAFLVGNWWTLVLLPILAIVVTALVILPEERYLERAFGKSYIEYKAKVRRWL